MRITFLGTGTSHGVPMIGCECDDVPLHRSARLAPPSLHLTSSCPTRQRAGRRRTRPARAGADAIGIRRVDAILFTHGHADHILGIDDVRRFNA